MSIFRQFIDIIYPPRCHICQDFLWKNRVKRDQEELSFCQACFDGFSEISSPLCPICSRPFFSEIEEDHPCEDCLRKRPFYDAVGAPYLYEGDLMAAIHQFKYAGRSYLANSLGPLRTEFCGACKRDLFHGFYAFGETRGVVSSLFLCHLCLLLVA